MKRFLILAFLALFMPPLSQARAQASVERDSGHPELAFTPLMESLGQVLLRKKDDGTIELRSVGARLESILQRIADAQDISLNFFCDDPNRSHERPLLRIAAPSVQDLVPQILGERYDLVLLDEHAQPVEKPGEASTFLAWGRDCARTSAPVRIVRPWRSQPTLRKNPEDISLDEVAHLLGTEGPTVRRAAVEVLRRNRDARGIGLAITALQDDDPEVMLAAVRALEVLGKEGKAQAETAAEAIYRRLLKKPHFQLVIPLAKLDKDRVWPVIEALLEAPDERTQSLAVRTIVVAAERRGIAGLSRIAASADLKTARQAAWAIGKLGGSTAALALRELLKSEEPKRQALAAQAISFLPEADGTEGRRDVERMIRQASVSDELLGAVAAVFYYQPLQSLLSDAEAETDLKLRALEVLARRASERSVETAALGLDDAVAEVRLEAVRTLSRPAVANAAPHLIRAARDPNIQVRREAVVGLSKLHAAPGSLPALSEALHDQDETVRKAAIDAFFMMGEPRGHSKEILKQALQHEDPYVSEKAASMLNHWGLY